MHLRGGQVARGGIRWSDRREDFRTEVLGLMKAQMVKNAVIVPVGREGRLRGQAPAGGRREELPEEVVACYQTFIRGLLDLTDNIARRRDRAADRRGPLRRRRPVSRRRRRQGHGDLLGHRQRRSRSSTGFWLGDAFASGGSTGYDHKKMGITARGAWESVKRHFRELGHDVQTEDFTVVGVGDMAGDVFGNGMLLSRHIQLVGAFNHRHVFIDPTRTRSELRGAQAPVRAAAARRGTTTTARLISAGGGVYERTAKSMPLLRGA